MEQISSMETGNRSMVAANPTTNTPKTQPRKSTPN
jgi:hypothetical protein